jgi:predicted DNA-binding transcriptional regulator AlpA
MIGVSSVTLWRMRRSGIIPQPVQISERCIGWPEDQIVDWKKSRDLNKSAYPPSAAPSLSSAPCGNLPDDGKAPSR